MIKDLALYNSKDGKNLMTVIYNGKECWVAGQVAEMSALQNASAAVHNFINESDLEVGVDFEVLKGEALSYFKSLINSVGRELISESYISPNTPNLTILYESGLWAFLSSLRTDEGKALRKWINREVLPSIRKTGAYSVGSKPTIESYDKFMERVERYAQMTGKNYEVNIQRAHNEACRVLGLNMQWQIELPDPYLNATQIAQRLGVYSATDKAGPAYGFIGKVCADLDLSPDDYVRCEDKTPFGKTIAVTNYFPQVVDKIKDWMDKNKPEKVKRSGREVYAYKFPKANASYVEFKDVTNN